MSLGDLLQTLEQDAAAEVRTLIAAAEARAAEHEAEALRAQDDRLTRALRECRETYQATADAELAAANRSMRARVLTARAAMLDRVRAAVRTLLPSYTARVASVLEQAAIAAAAGERYEIRHVPTGVVVELENGTQIVATLEALFEREAPRLEAALLDRLSQEVSP